MLGSQGSNARREVLRTKGSISLIKHESTSKETQLLFHGEAAALDQRSRKVTVGARKSLGSPMT